LAIDVAEIARSLSHRMRGRRQSHAVNGVEITLEERVAEGVRAELTGDRSHILGALPPGRSTPIASSRRSVPERWSVVHVMDRLEEAWLTLSRMPIATRPQGHGNCMPAYVYDRFDLNAQLETHELERSMRAKNRVTIPPTPDEVTRMDQAFGWIVSYLSREEDQHLARAVNLGTRLAAFGLPFSSIKALVPVTAHAFTRRKMHGLEIIAIGLIRDGVPVS
jgi:hypothetical protein